MSRQWSGGICLRKNASGIEILLVCEPSESDLKDSYRWSLPGGKCCDNYGKMVSCCTETPEQTIIRESKEETGYDIVTVRLFGQEEKDMHKRYVFVINIVAGHPLGKKIPGDKESPAWFPIKSLPRNTFPSHRRIIEQYVLSRIKARSPK